MTDMASLIWNSSPSIPSACSITSLQTAAWINANSAYCVFSSRRQHGEILLMTNRTDKIKISDSNVVFFAKCVINHPAEAKTFRVINIQWFQAAKLRTEQGFCRYISTSSLYLWSSFNNATQHCIILYPGRSHSTPPPPAL